MSCTVEQQKSCVIFSHIEIMMDWIKLPASRFMFAEGWYQPNQHAMPLDHQVFIWSHASTYLQDMHAKKLDQEIEAKIDIWSGAKVFREAWSSAYVQLESEMCLWKFSFLPDVVNFLPTKKGIPIFRSLCSTFFLVIRFPRKLCLRVAFDFEIRRIYITRWFTD